MAAEGACHAGFIQTLPTIIEQLVESASVKPIAEVADDLSGSRVVGKRHMIDDVL